MGYVRVRALVGNAERTSVAELELLVDTGAFYTVIPRASPKRSG